MDTTVSRGGFVLPTIRKIDAHAPWQWLEAGWRDLNARPLISLGYGFAFVLASYALVGALLYLDVLHLLLPLAAGVMFAGPMLAVGLYEMSRRLEAGEPITVRSVALVATRSPEGIAAIGLVLALFMLAWTRIATLLFAIFFGLGAPSLDQVIQTLFFTQSGLLFVALGSAVGGVLAVLAFAISAVSIPRLMAQETDVMTAIATSVAAVTRNLWPMLLWGWLITMLIAVGVATLFLGLAVVFPLVGHATWHAYRALVDESV